MNHHSSLPVTLLGAPKRISPVTDQNPRSLANLPDFNEAQTRKNNRFFGQSKLTGAQARPSWLPIYFGKAQVAHFHMKMLQNLLISARARPKKRRGGKKRGPNLQQFFQFLPNFSVFDFLWQPWLDFASVAKFDPSSITWTPILTSSPISLLSGHGIMRPNRTILRTFFIKSHCSTPA